MDKQDLDKLPKKTLLPGFASGRYEPVRQYDHAEFRKPPFEDPVRRDNRVSVRISGQDMGKLHKLALAEGLPLQVIAETADWRRVCDPEGAMAWVHQRTVESRRTVMRTQEQPLDLRRAATADAPVAARLAGRSTATLDQCKDGWCRVSVGRARGWIPQTEVWGSAESPQCRPPLPVVRR